MAAGRVMVDGIISADAPDLNVYAYVSAGSGGGIRLDAAVLSGGGLITARGGDDQFSNEVWVGAEVG